MKFHRIIIYTATGLMLITSGVFSQSFKFQKRHLGVSALNRLPDTYGQLYNLQERPVAGGREADLNIERYSLMAAALFVPSVLAGFGLTKSGTPYNTWLVNGHKLTAAGGVFMLNYAVYQANKIAPLNASEWTSLVVTNLGFVSTIATGAMLTFDKPMPGWVKTVHHAGPWVSLVSSALLMYLLGS